jgi:hypothetical protein
MARTLEQQKSLNDAIIMGVVNSDAEMLRLALEKGGDADRYVTEANSRGTLSKQPEDLLLLALKKGADPNTMLFAAIAQKSLSVAKIAVEQGGADVNCTHAPPGSRDSMPAVIWSYKNFSSELSDYLVARGMNVDMPAADGTTALLYAVKDDDSEKTMHYLRHGANPFIANKKGEFALRQAQDAEYQSYRSSIYQKKAEIVKAMLKNVPGDAETPAETPAAAFNAAATAKDISVNHPLELKRNPDNAPPPHPTPHKGFQL